MAWKSPPVGWLKLNTDASTVKHNPDSVGIGGLIRNENGEWANGFRSKIGMCNVLTTDLWAIREGLFLTWEMMISR